MRLLLTLLAAWLFAATPALAQKRIALTFDDVPRAAGAFLPVDQRAEQLIAALEKGGVDQAAFFVNPGSLAKPEGARGTDRIDAYVAAGHVIANHSFSHPALTDTSASDYLADIDRAEAWLKPRAGHRPWFRFPFLNEGRADKAKRDAIRAGLAARGLRNGYVTAEAIDWHMEALTIAAKAAGKAMDMDALRGLYVESHVGAAEFNEALAIKTTGRPIIQVMLLHETDLAALFIDDLAAALKAKGWTIVTADIAYADPIAASAATVDVPSAQGTLTEALAWAKGLPAPRWYERNDPRKLDALFRRPRAEGKAMTHPTPGYAFDFDRRKGLMRIVIRGLWNAEMVEAFYADALAATEDMRHTHASHDTLVDARDFPVQPAQITDGIAGLMQMGMDMNDGRTAVISHGYLGKMQGDRLNPNPRLKIFLAEADAVAWLAEPQSPATD